jgi:hypothetical protein
MQFVVQIAGPAMFATAFRALFAFNTGLVMRNDLIAEVQHLFPCSFRLLFLLLVRRLTHHLLSRE